MSSIMRERSYSLEKKTPDHTARYEITYSGFRGRGEEDYLVIFYSCSSSVEETKIQHKTWGKKASMRTWYTGIFLMKIEIDKQQNSFCEIILKHAVRNNLFLSSFLCTKVILFLLFLKRGRTLYFYFLSFHTSFFPCRLVLNTKELENWSCLCSSYEKY